MNTLTDGQAIHTLKTIAKGRLAANTLALPPENELRTLLTKSFGETTLTQTTEGDLARAALALLAEDPAYADPISVLSNEPNSPQKYIEPSTIMLITAAILALQTRVKFKADHTHKWSAEVEKKALSDVALKTLIEHLLRFLDRR